MGNNSQVNNAEISEKQKKFSIIRGGVFALLAFIVIYGVFMSEGLKCIGTIENCGKYMNTQTISFNEPTLLNLSLMIIVSLTLGAIVGDNKHFESLKTHVESDGDNYSI